MPNRFTTFAERHPRWLVAGELAAFAIFLGFAGWAVSGDFGEAVDGLADADVGEFFVGCGFIAIYYLVFVIGWMRILRAWDIRINYKTALRAEMISMLAKYVPGGIWTPAARIVAVRRAGVTDSALVAASIFIEAGLSAVAGVLVFVVGLRWVDGVDAPLAPLLLFAGLLVVLLHPRIFQAAASKLVRRFRGHDLPELPWRALLELFGFYCFTWLLGGAGLLFLVRSVGEDPALSAIPFLGGVAAVGAIVAVLAFFAPSGLGPREATMYGLLLAVTTSGAALAATALNRIAITIVEVLVLLLAGVGPRLLERVRPVTPHPKTTEGRSHGPLKDPAGRDASRLSGARSTRFSNSQVSRHASWSSTSVSISTSTERERWLSTPTTCRWPSGRRSGWGGRTRRRSSRVAGSAGRSRPCFPATVAATANAPSAMHSATFSRPTTDFCLPCGSPTSRSRSGCARQTPESA